VLDLRLAAACFMWHASKSGKATVGCTIGTAGWSTNAIHTIAARLRKAVRMREMRESMMHANVLRAWRQAFVSGGTLRMGGGAGR